MIYNRKLLIKIFLTILIGFSFFLLFFSKSEIQAGSGYYCTYSNDSSGAFCDSGWVNSCDCNTGKNNHYCATYYAYITCVQYSTECTPYPRYKCSYNFYTYSYQDGDCNGTCVNCTPSCPNSNWTKTNTGCSTTGVSCTKYYSYCTSRSCGTVNDTCYYVKRTVTFNANGGSCTPTTRTPCHSSSAAGPTSCTRTGYTLSNYSVTSGTCGGTFTPSTGACSSVTGDITVRANWTINVYRVTYDANGGSCTPTYRDVNYNTTAAAPSCTKTGYVTTSFIRTVGSGGNLDSATGEVTNVSGNQTIQAQWGGIPTIPTVPYCNGASNPTNVTTANPTFSAIFNDPDTGDTGNYYEIEVNTQSDFLGTVKWDSNIQSMTATAIGARSPNITYGGSSLGWTGTTYYWRIRFGDSTALMSPWSNTQNFTMHNNANTPTATNLQTEQLTNPIQVVDTTPEFRAQFNDADSGDTGIQYEIEVNTNSSFSGTIMWDSGLQSMTSTPSGSYSPEVSYAGNTLTLDGTIYYWRIRFGDNYGSVGSWSATANFTMNNPPSATLLTTETLSNPTKIYDMTPEFSAQFNDVDSGATGNYYQINVNTQSDFMGTSMWDSTKTSMTPISNGSRTSEISYAGTALTSNGQIYYLRFKFWDSAGTESAWSSTANFRTTVAPSTPTSLLTDGQTNPTYLTSYTPTFSAIYSDLNSDQALYYEINVNSNSSFTGTIMWNTGKLSTTVSSGSRSPDYTYAGTALTGTSGTTYYWRIRFWDVDDNVSNWSAVNNFSDNLKHLFLKGLRLKGLRFN